MRPPLITSAVATSFDEVVLGQPDVIEAQLLARHREVKILAVHLGPGSFVELRVPEGKEKPAFDGHTAPPRADPAFIS
jgi:hypothetical protein